MFLLKILVSSFAIVIAAYFLPGVTLNDFTTAVIVAFVLSLLNSFLKPIIVLLTIPVTVFTFGIFLLFINAFIISTTAYFVDGFEIRSFGWAFIFSIVLSIVTSLLEGMNKKFDRNKHPNNKFNKDF